MDSLATKNVVGDKILTLFQVLLNMSEFVSFAADALDPEIETELICF